MMTPEKVKIRATGPTAFTILVPTHGDAYVHLELVIFNIEMERLLFHSNLR